MTNQQNKSTIFISSLLIALLFLCSCSNESKKSEIINSYSNQKSPLDSIFGDKILEPETGELRKDNFRSLLKIRKEQLKIESTLYNVKQLDNSHFVLSQKMKYADARNFNILLKTNDLYIKDYIVFNDFYISDIKPDANNWVLLLSDINQPNTYWKSNQQIKIVKLDSNLNELWNYSKNSTFPLSGQSLIISSEYYSFNIEVITECDICFTLAQLVLNKDGQFSSVKSIGKQNSTQLSDKQLQEIFGKKG